MKTFVRGMAKFGPQKLYMQECSDVCNFANLRLDNRVMAAANKSYKAGDIGAALRATFKRRPGKKGRMMPPKRQSRCATRTSPGVVAIAGGLAPPSSPLFPELVEEIVDDDDDDVGAPSWPHTPPPLVQPPTVAKACARAASTASRASAAPNVKAPGKIMPAAAGARPPSASRTCGTSADAGRTSLRPDA